MGKLNIDKLRERLEQLNNSGSNRGNGAGFNFLNLKDGRNVIRILPPREGADMFFEEVWVHYGVGKNAQNKNGTMVVCPKTHDENAPCPVCELADELKKLSKKRDDSYDKQSRSIRRKKRVYYNAISRDEDLSVYEKNEEGKWINTETGEEESPVKVLGTGIGILKDIISLIVDPEYGDITDPEEGLDLIITKTGSGQFNTKYDVKTVRKESPIGFDAWEECLHDLSQLAKAKSYDEILAIMQGEEPEGEDEGDNEDEEPENEEPKQPEPDPATDDADDLQNEIKAALARRRKNR
jgi:hypothetical protein